MKTHEESTVSFALEDLITRSFRTKKPEQKIVVEEPIRLEELTKNEPTQSETISRISDHVHAEDIAIEISLDDRYKGRVSNFFFWNRLKNVNAPETCLNFSNTFLFLEKTQNKCIIQNT